MKIFISGGCKNGKSTHALSLAQKIRKRNAPLYYIATMIPHDDEDKMRISRHVKNRSGMGFETFEVFYDIDSMLNACNTGGSFLIDSTTALLANEMFRDSDVCYDASSKICLQLRNVLNSVQDIVIVSDYIFSDAMQFDDLTESFRKALAEIDRTCAQYCDVVLEACCGNFTAHKGSHIFKMLQSKSFTAYNENDLYGSHQGNSDIEESMILIIGGAHQGKLDFARKEFGVSEKDVFSFHKDCKDCDCLHMPSNDKKVVSGLKNLIQAQFNNGMDGVDSQEYFSRILPQLKGKILICEDIFCGIVPYDPDVRAFREYYAAALNYLSRNADSVYRIFCGLATKIK